MHCSLLCLCSVQVVQPDPRVTRLVEELSNSLKREAELPEGDQIPAVLVLNKVCCNSLLSAESKHGRTVRSLTHCRGFAVQCKAAWCVLRPGLESESCNAV